MRPRDLSFETLCEVCGMDWQHLTANERGRTNAALKQIRDLEAELSDELLAAAIRGHAVAYRQAYPGIPLTPTALANNWSLVIPLAKEKAALRVQTNAPASRTGCPECGGDKWVDAGYDERGFPISRPCSTCQPVPSARHDPRRVAPAVPVGRALRRSDPLARQQVSGRRDDNPVDRPVRDHDARPVRDPPVGQVTVTCALCGHEIFEHEFGSMHAQWISWYPETGRRGGGPHDRGKAPLKTAARAHGDCVDAAHRGRLNQENLFDQLVLSPVPNRKETQ
jgi:hypothetical protein